VYIKEAHPTDGWRMSGNDAAGISFAQPKNFEQRFEVAEKCAARLDMKTPVVIDSMDNQTAENYAAFPDRLYIVDMDGNVAYKGGRGPFGYKPREMEQVLLLLMMEAQVKARSPRDNEPAGRGEATEKESGLGKETPVETKK